MSYELKKAELQKKLQKALELEWATIPPYLTAWWSLRPGHNGEVRGIIKSVFLEEMLHMVLAANVLSAVGGRPRLQDVPGYPLRMEFDGKEFQDRQFDVRLEPFSPSALEVFLQIELPQPPPQATIAAAHIHIPGYTIGEFYSGIESDLRSLCAEAGEAKVFTGDPALQVPEDFYWGGGGAIIRVTSLETALAALTLIVDQGEGAREPGGAPPGFFDDRSKVPHYYRFREIQERRRYARRDDPEKPPTGEALLVNYDAVYPGKADCTTQDMAADSDLLALNTRFNESYTGLMQELEEGLNGNHAVLYTAIMDRMHELTKYAISVMQTRLPNDPHQRHALPTFEQSGGRTLPAGSSRLQAREASISSLLATASSSAPSWLAAEVAEGIAILRESEQRPYYDEAADLVDRTGYYMQVGWNQLPDRLFLELSKLVSSTHSKKLSYKPSAELYPWVDLHPDHRLRSIYSGESYTPEEMMRRDLEIQSERQRRLNSVLASEGPEFSRLRSAMEAISRDLPFNCEHTVPQSWFGKKAPMKGDLHHLFACESGCNTRRDNIPYFEFSAREHNREEKCGYLGDEGFEPIEGKGLAARATLYFLLRYPGWIGDNSKELPASRLSLLLQWHNKYPVGPYERHRNQAIFQRQGNRNPLIDFPEYAARIDFTKGFGNP